MGAGVFDRGCVRGGDGGRGEYCGGGGAVGGKAVLVGALVMQWRTSWGVEKGLRMQWC